MAKKHHSRRHKTSAEILEEMKSVAKESRMADRTPWTAMQIMTSYAMMNTFCLGGEELLNLSNEINNLEEKWWNGFIQLSPYQERMYQAAGFKVVQEDYTNKDIIASKSRRYEHYLEKVQIEPKNRINRQATRYLTWFYNVLIDMQYTESEITKVSEFMQEMFEQYRTDGSQTNKWRTDLYEKAGFLTEQPIDPLTEVAK